MPERRGLVGKLAVPEPNCISVMLSDFVCLLTRYLVGEQR
jgi:hypothetical protein